ncbi:hypothetical protein ACFWHL_36665 [Streptomyces massasporeus]
MVRGGGRAGHHTERRPGLLHAWAAGQNNLHEGDVQAGCERPFGQDADQHAAVIALCELEDEKTASVVTR